MKKILSILIGLALIPSTAFAAFPPATVSQGGTGIGQFSANAVIVSGQTATSSLSASSTPTVDGIVATSSIASIFANIKITNSTTTNSTTTAMALFQNLWAQGSTTFSGLFTSSATSTFIGGLISDYIKAYDSGGVDLFASNGTNVALFGAGGGSNATFYGGVTINGALSVPSALSTFANIQANGSSTLQNFTFVNATGTSATTTNMFSTTASSTNLFAQNLYANITLYQSFTYATTSWSGTTTRALETVYKPTIYNSIACFTDTGTVNVDIYHGATHIKTPSTVLNASTTNNVNTYNTGNVAAVGDKVYVDMGTPATSPTQLNCTVSKTLISN